MIPKECKRLAEVDFSMLLLERNDGDRALLLFGQCLPMQLWVEPPLYGKRCECSRRRC